MLLAAWTCRKNHSNISATQHCLLVELKEKELGNTLNCGPTPGPCSKMDPHQDHVVRWRTLDPHQDHVVRWRTLDPHQDHVAKWRILDPYQDHLVSWRILDPHQDHVVRWTLDPHQDHIVRWTLDPHQDHVVRWTLKIKSGQWEEMRVGRRRPFSFLPYLVSSVTKAQLP